MELNIKQEFPATKNFVYFKNAAISLCPKSTLDLISEYIEERRQAFLREGPISVFRRESRWLKNVDESKKLFAKVIGAKESEVAFIPNATTGINLIFSMLPMKKGKNIVTTDIAYPMGAIVCLKQREKGVETRFVKNVNSEVRTEDFESMVDDNTVAVFVDQAGWYNGFLYDLKALSEIAHEHGAYLVVDGIQSIGGKRWDVRREGVDFLATSTYKWLLGGPFTQSAGFLYIREEHMDSFQPVFVGNQTIEPEQLERNVYECFDLYDFKYRSGMERFQIYPKYELAYVAVGNSMKILLSQGLGRIERKIKKLDTLIIDGILDYGFELQTPVEEEKRLYVNIKMKNNREVERKLAERKIIVSARVGGLRVAPNFYNNEDEVERFLEGLREVTK